MVVDKKKQQNKVTKNYPHNPLRPLEISQATYEALLLIFMNDMGASESFFWPNDATKQNNEYMKALGTFILGEAIGDYLWPSNWLKLLNEEFQDVRDWNAALIKNGIDSEGKMFTGNFITALTKRSVLHSPNFDEFLKTTRANPVDRKYANKEAGSQKPFPSALTTRRVLEPFIVPYRRSQMDCDPRNPATNLEALTTWIDDLPAVASPFKHSTAFQSSMVDFYGANIFPDPELFLPYMIALSPSLRNAQLAIEEYKKFVAKEVCPILTNDCCDPFLSYLTNKSVPAIPNFEKNYLLLAEKFNTNRDYLKVSVGPIIENMVLPIAVKFGVFTVKTGTSLADRRTERAKIQRTRGHAVFTMRVNFTATNFAKYWHVFLKNMIFSYQEPARFYFPHWLYACSSRYIAASAALRDRDFVVINVEDPKKRAYLVRWCNIKNFLSRDACNLAVLLSRDAQGVVTKKHIMTFQEYIQMIPRPQLAANFAFDVGGLEQASFTNCFEKICAPNQDPCYPISGAQPLPELPELPEL